MKGDFSRLRFSPNKNYTSVLQQQGRVSLDADANEQCAIDEYLRATEAVDIIGPVGGPEHDQGFGITVENNALVIGKGRYYVDGILCQNAKRELYADQPYLLNPSPTGSELIAGLKNGSINTVQVYLEVWRRLVTALDDPCLREPALGMADTTARLQTVWRVVARGLKSAPTEAIAGTVALTNGSVTVTGTGTSFRTALTPGEQIFFASDTTKTPYTISAVASGTSLTLTANYAGATTQSTTVTLIEPAGGCCGSMDTGLLDEKDPGQLSARTGAGSGDCSCQPMPAAGYLGLENQLYRVEIHHAGTAATATFKWSRENGSVVVAITGISGSQVYVDSLGPDANLGFAVGQWMEISDDTNLFGEDANQPGDLYQIKSISPGTLSLTMTAPVASVNPTKNARMRRWDQFGNTAVANGVGLAQGTWLNLENGIQVEFAKGNYESGDHWLIPARAASGQIEWPPCNSDGNAFQPAHRIDVYLAPLACIQYNTQKQAVQVQDCRKSFPPLTELTPNKTSTCCTYRVGDGVESFGGYTSIQAAVDALPDEGGEICILPGLYHEHVLIRGKRDVVIHGCGWQTRVTSPSAVLSTNPGTAVLATAVKLNTVGTAAGAAVNNFAAIFTVAASEHIKFRSFCIEAGTDEAGILLDGTGTSLSTNQTTNLASVSIARRGVYDVTIEDLVFTGSTLPAVLAEGVDLLRIDRNRVAMKNVASQWPAIFASGTEIHIDRNFVGIQNAAILEEWIPATVVDDLNSSSPTTATPVLAQTANTTVAETDVTRTFIAADGLNLISVTVALHPGGIQIGGPSTDVYILENEIQGGSRNGITLGSVEVLDANGGGTGIWIGTVTGSKSSDCNCEGTLHIAGTFTQKTGYTVVAGGTLTNVQIHRNRIRNMGLCGIGPVGFFNLVQTLEIISTVGLNISQNEISRVLLADFTAAGTQTGAAAITTDVPGSNATTTSTALQNLLGYGAICIADAQGLIIRDNMITNFGPQAGSDAGGIFVLHGEQIEISRNQVLETRDWSGVSEIQATTTSISRGGIVIFLGTPPTFSQPLDDSVWGYTTANQANQTGAISAPVYEPGLPAVRIDGNVVRVPLAHALEIFGLGPFSIVNNHLTCGGLVRPVGTEIAQTVLILNLGTSIESATAANAPSGVYTGSKAAAGGVSAASFQNVSCGSVLFSNNVCQLESTVSLQREYSSVFIYTPDHLIFSNNHCWLNTARLSSLVDALLLAGSLNVVGNRFQESPVSVLFSAMTVGALNVTGQNISTFCLLVLGALSAENNNIALIQGANKDLCGEWEKVLAAAL